MTPVLIGQSADAELLRSVAHGDVDAFERLYDRHADSMYSLASCIVGERCAELVCERAFAEARHEAGEEARRARPTINHWLANLVRRHAHHVLREQNVELERVRAACSWLERMREERLERERTQGVGAREESRRTIQDLLSRLPESDRAAVELAYFRGLRRGEIAEALGVTQVTVARRLRRALHSLPGAPLSCDADTDIEPERCT